MKQPLQSSRFHPDAGRVHGSQTIAQDVKMPGLTRRNLLAILGMAVGLVGVACGRATDAPAVQATPRPSIPAPAPVSATVAPIAVPAPSPSVTSAFPLRLTDDAGRAVTIPAQPKRVVSGAPSTTEIMFALGFGSRLFGVTKYCDFPEEAKAKPQIGGLKPNLEAILAQGPDMVLAVRGFPADIIALLEQQQIPVIMLNPADVAGIFGNITMVGQVMGAEAIARDLVSRMRARWDAVAARASGISVRPRVLYEIDASDPGAVSVAGPGTFIDAMITAAGGVNVVAAIAAGKQYPKISAEAVLSVAPDLLILGDAPYGQSARQVAERPGWDAVPAVRTGRVIEFSQREVDVTSRPGPRIVDGLEAIARTLHPDVFGKTDLPAKA